MTPYAKGQYYKFPHVARCSTPKVVHIHSDKPDIVTCLDGECITSDDVTIRLAEWICTTLGVEQRATWGNL